MYFIEPNLWTTNYFVTSQYTVSWFALNVLVYAFIFDAWFYWTHRALHESKYLWDKIHTTHHAFKNPSAFCQDAVHPLEGLIQGREYFLYSKIYIYISICISLLYNNKHKRSCWSLFNSTCYACSSGCFGTFWFIYFVLC